MRIKLVKSDNDKFAWKLVIKNVNWHKIETILTKAWSVFTLDTYKSITLWDNSRQDLEDQKVVIQQLFA